MVLTEDVLKKEIRVTNQEFEINSLYKKIKKKIDGVGYTLFEKEHSVRPEKYGNEVKFVFDVYKDYDDFGRGNITLNIIFENLTKIKGKDLGDLSVYIMAKEIIDYKNRWGMNKFNKFLLEMYSKLKEKEFEKKYEEPIVEAALEIYNTIKEDLE